MLTAGLAAILARRVRAGDSVDAQREDTVLPDPGDSSAPPVSEPFELSGLSPYVTPNDDFYRIDTALSTPQVDAGGWRLRVTGLVDAPFELSYDELLAFDSVETTVTIACVSNEVGGRPRRQRRLAGRAPVHAARPGRRSIRRLAGRRAIGRRLHGRLSARHRP